MRARVMVRVRVGLLAIRIDEGEAELILTEYLVRVRLGLGGWR